MRKEIEETSPVRNLRGDHQPSDGSATRLSLLSRIKDWRDHESWQVFFDTYSKLIYGQAIKAGLRDVEAQEVVQDTMIEVADRIQTFQYDLRAGSFRGWLFRLARWRIANQFHKRREGTIPIESVDLDDPKLSCQSANDEPDASWEQDWRRTIFDAAVKKLRQKLPLNQFQVFDLLVRKQWSVAAVAQTLRMNRGYLYLVKFRAKRLLKQEMARLSMGRF